MKKNQNKIISAYKVGNRATTHFLLNYISIIGALCMWGRESQIVQIQIKGWPTAAAKRPPIRQQQTIDASAYIYI